MKNAITVTTIKKQNKTDKAELASLSIAKLIDYDRSLLQDTVTAECCKILAKKVVSVKDYDKIRMLLGIPFINAGEYSSRRAFDIDYSAKVLLVRFVDQMITNEESHLIAIFLITKKSLKEFLYSPQSRIAILMRNYFVCRNITLAKLRSELKIELGITFNRTSLSRLTPDNIRKIKFIFCRKLNTSMARYYQLFGATTIESKALAFQLFNNAPINDETDPNKTYHLSA